MKYRKIFTSTLAVVLTCWSLTAHAQEDGQTDEQPASEQSATTQTDANESGGGGMNGENSLEAGNVSLAFGVPTGGNPYASGTAGVWYMVTDQINVGMNLGFGIDATKTVTGVGTDDEDSTTRTGFDLLLAPALRYYLMNDSAVAPYILGQLNFHKFFDGNNDTQADPEKSDFNSALQPELALIGGFGLEWFPVENFSIGGHVGLGIDILRQDSQSGDPESTGGATVNRNGLRIGTFTSSLNANIYF